jgi:hypothetical protein
MSKKSYSGFLKLFVTKSSCSLPGANFSSYPGLDSQTAMEGSSLNEVGCAMTRIIRLQTIAARYGLTLVEFFALEVVGVFAADRKTAARFIRQLLKDSPHADENCLAALQSCINRGWIRVTPHNLLAATTKGAALMLRISTDLGRPA